MEINRNKIGKIINELDNISQKYNDDDFNLAVYLYARLGKFEFDNYISNDELIEINKILKKHNTVFNEDINEEITMILNNDILGYYYL